MSILLGWVSGLVTIFLYIFPNVDQNTLNLITSKVNEAKVIINTLNILLPVNTLLLFFSIVLTTELVLLTIKLTAWLLHTITLGFFKRL